MITSTPKTIRPRSCTESELKKLGVVLLDEKNIRLGCSTCGRQWSPLLGKDGRLLRGYWTCPEGCNFSK